MQRKLGVFSGIKTGNLGLPVLAGAAAALTYSISGVVYDSDGSTPVASATITLGALTATSAANGTYSFTGLAAGTSGSMTCTKTGYVWPAITVSAIAGNLTSQNYTNAWYALGGILANAVVAYQAEGAGSQTEAYINMANPGTYDRVAPVAPTWGATDGLIFTGTQYLTTGIRNFAKTWTVIEKFKDMTTNGGLTHTLIGMYVSSSDGFFLVPSSAGVRQYKSGGKLDVATLTPTGIMAASNRTAYFNGSPIGSIPDGSITQYEVWEGCINRPSQGGASNLMTGKKLITAIYDIALSDAQVLAICNLMNGTPARVLAPQRAITPANNAWTWFGRPHALHYNNRTYFSGIRTDGKITMSDYNHNTNGALRTWWSDDVTEVDDHDQPGLLIRDSDKKLLAFYSKHGGNNVYMRVASVAESAAAWGAETALDASIGSDVYTYPSPVQLLDEANDPIYLFYRDNPAGTERLSYTVSTDGGATWAAGTAVVANGANRVYFQFVKNGEDRIDFVVSSHPASDATSSIYHFYYKAGKYYKTDGTEITASLPLAYSDLTLVYSGATTRAWVWDIAIDGTGKPVAIYATFPNAGNDHRYNYAYWTGSAWSTHEICTAGGPLYAGETYYSGGISINPANVLEVYCSRQVSGQFDIYRYTSADGDTWTLAERLTNTAEVDMRPVVPANPNSGLKVIWLHGTYTTYTNYSLTAAGSAASLG